MKPGAAKLTLEAARRLLDVEADADAEGLRSARNRAMMSAHPDHGGSEDALRLVIEAYAVLTGEWEAAPTGRALLEITPAIAMLGGRQVVRLNDGRRLAISLPAGLRQGDKVGAGGSIFSVRIKASGGVFVSGDDLCMQVRASSTMLTNGGRMKVKTPAGYCMVWIPKQLGSNRIVRVLGRGLPPRGRYPQGALVLKLVPDRAAGEAKAAGRRRA
ncbi:MAG TPA: DnaJ C-terminal domain-containing protein [Caulobacteraceae bacterium]|nr:DnaJ C-terminal domain-containing protein [Caulobacteraceae bacterium]